MENLHTVSAQADGGNPGIIYSDASDTSNEYKRPQMGKGLKFMIISTAGSVLFLLGRVTAPAALPASASIDNVNMSLAPVVALAPLEPPYDYCPGGSTLITHTYTSCDLNTATPTPTDTATPTKTPTNTPTASPTASPTETPTNTPTASPTASPTETPTNTPTASPTASPTETPTNTPTASPTASPTETPTNTPTASPTASPTETPTKTPTASPTASPTETPTDTATPTTTPTNTPTATVCPGYNEQTGECIKAIPTSPLPIINPTPTPVETPTPYTDLFKRVYLPNVIRSVERQDLER